MMKLKLILVLIFIACLGIAWVVVGGSPKKSNREAIYGEGLILCD